MATDKSNGAKDAIGSAGHRGSTAPRGRAERGGCNGRGDSAARGGTASGRHGVQNAPLSGLLDVTAPEPRDPVRIDAVDRRLLGLLAIDARASQRKLARDLHMSPPAVGERIGRLERLGVIRGYAVEIDWTALGYVTVFLAVTAVQGADQAAILEAIQALPEVEGIVVITGSMDMLARLRVRDHGHLRTVLLSRIWRIEGVQRTETFIGLAEMAAKKGYVGDLLASLDQDPQGESPGAGAPAAAG